MTNDFKKKDFLPVYCEKCRQQGYIFSDNFDEPAFIVCNRCRSETSHVWCPKCGMGGGFIKELLKERPRSWVCSDCKTEYILPPLFYEEPIHLYLEDELPDNIRKRVDYPDKGIPFARPPFPIFVPTFLIILVYIIFFYALLVIHKIEIVMCETGLFAIASGAFIIYTRAFGNLTIS